jgi:hypothetical protein
MLALWSSRRLHRRSERHRSPAATEPQCPDYVQAKAGRPVAPTSGLLELGHLFPGAGLLYGTCLWSTVVSS